MTWRVRSSASTSKAPSLDAVEGLCGDALGSGLGRVDVCGHVGVDVADMQSGDVDAARLQVQTQGVGLRPEGRLGRAVGTEDTEPRQHRMDVQEVAAAVALDDRHEGAGDEQGTVEVGLELAADVLDGRVEEVRVHGRARVVDQDGDVLRLLGRRRDGRRVADLQRQRHRVRVRDGLRVARGGVHLLGAALVQGRDQRPADAAAAAGDQDYGAFDVRHGELRGETERGKPIGFRMSTTVNRSVSISKSGAGPERTPMPNGTQADRRGAR